MIDIHSTPAHFQGQRKRSFTLPEGNDLSGEELDEKIEEIKKLINTEPEKKTKTLIIQNDSKTESKEGHKEIENKREEELPEFNRLATIQEQAK